MQQAYTSYYQQPDVRGTCDSSQNAYYPAYDQNLYQYGETGYEYSYHGDIIKPSPYQDPSKQPFYSCSSVSEWFAFSDTCYLKGFLAGAGITFLVSNSTVQKAIVRGVINLFSVVQGGVEEVKEQIRDIKAEMSQKSEK